MGAKGEYSVLELDGSRLTAITAVVHANRVEVRRWLSAFRPETVPGDNAKAIGEWVGSEFSRAGLPKGRVVLAISRGDIVLKQLSLPMAADLTEADLSNMVRLQMSRQLTMGLDGAALDYAVVGEEMSGGLRATSVLAGAMPADRVAWCRQVMSGAGLKLNRIGLRSFGAASLLAELSQRRSGPVLGIAVGASSAEFVVVQDGKMMFARAADVPRPTQRDEIDSFAERISVEAKRTWMSFRSGRTVADLEVVALIGEGDLARRVAERCAQGLGCAADTVTVPPGVVLPEHMPEGERAIAAPLAGLLLEQLVDKPTLDFANPRRAPDRFVRQRQVALLAVLGIIVVGGFGLVTAKKSLRVLEEKRTTLLGAEASLKKKADEALA
ncbi:MAG: pilus assembly protein PilM, partial [Phycisphaerales bacterium]